MKDDSLSRWPVLSCHRSNVSQAQHTGSTGLVAAMVLGLSAGSLQAGCVRFGYDTYSESSKESMEGFDGSPDGAILPPDEADARAFAVHVMECQARADGLDDEQICACVNDGDFPHGISNWAVGRGEYWTLESEDDEQGDDERGDDEPGEVAANLPRPTTDWLGDHESIAAVFRVRRLEFGPSCSARGVETLGFIVRGIELNDDGSLALTKDNFTQMDLNHFNIAGNNRFAGELYGVPDHGVPSSYRGVKDQVARTLLNRALPFDSE